MKAMIYPMRSVKCSARIEFTIMTALFVIGLSACAGPTTSNTVTVNGRSQTPAPQASPEGFRFGYPVESESHALIAAQGGLGTSFLYVEPLTVVSVEEMGYGEYSKRVGAGSDRPADMKVWLVIYFDDHWQSIAPRPDVKPSPAFRGCVSVLINAADGLPLETSGPLEKGKMPVCDK